MKTIKVAEATQQAVEMEVFGLQWPGEDRINLSTVFDTETEALEYMKNRCDTPGIRPVRFSSNAPTAQLADSVLEDAARYRLLRRGQHWSVIDGIGDDLLRAEALDAAVDAVLAAQGGKV